MTPRESCDMTLLHASEYPRIRFSSLLLNFKTFGRFQIVHTKLSDQKAKAWDEDDEELQVITVFLISHLFNRCFSVPMKRMCVILRRLHGKLWRG